MGRANCDAAEDIVRAVTTAYWDSTHGRVSSALFKGEKISVSRLAILPLHVLFAVHRRELHQPPRVSVLGAAEINVGLLQRIGMEHSQPIALDVEIVPTDNNPAHAEIPQKISRGLASALSKAVHVHRDPDSTA
jgi:hypothetical protein